MHGSLTKDKLDMQDDDINSRVETYNDLSNNSGLPEGFEKECEGSCKSDDQTYLKDQQRKRKI